MSKQEPEALWQKRVRVAIDAERAERRAKLKKIGVKFAKALGWALLSGALSRLFALIG